MKSTEADFDQERVVKSDVKLRGLAGVYEAGWRFFCSLRLTVVVIFSLTAGCFLGMFFDQTLTLERHREMWAEAKWKLWLFERLEFHDVFHSWWFGLVVIMLALNLTACSIERLPKIWIDIQNPERKLSDRQLFGIRNVYRQTLASEQIPRAIEAIRALLKTKGPHAFEEQDGQVHYFFNERHRYARTGVYLVHIALLMIMFGSMATTYSGIDGMMMIVENSNGRFVQVKGPGGLTYKHDLGFEVRCTDFELKTFVNGAPMEFESDLEVVDPAFPDKINPVVRQTIQVNHPLEYAGYTFYQASYNPIPGDQLVQLDVCKRPASSDEMGAFQACRDDARNIHLIAIGDKVTVADGTSFVPIEIIREYGGLGSAVRVQQESPNGSRTTFVVFRDYPKFDEQVRRGDYVVGFRGFDQQYATGIQVGRVPFINVVFVGFLLMFTGMYMAFFMSQRRYWARIRPTNNGTCELIVCGAARRHQYQFEEEFQKVSSTLIQVFGEVLSVKDRARALRESRRPQKAAT